MGLRGSWLPMIDREALGFIFAAAAAWLSARMLFGYGWAEPSLALSWALSAGMLAWWSLAAVDYFKYWRPRPRKSDLLILLVALPIPALVLKYLFLATLKEPVAQYREILLAAPWTAAWVYLYQSVLGGALGPLSRRDILAVLLPSERVEILSAMKEKHIHCRLRHFQRASPYLLRQRRPNLIVISRSATRAFDAHGNIIHAHLQGHPIVDNRQLLSDLRGRIDLANADLWSFLLLATRQTPFLRMYSQIKRILEPMAALLLLIALSPLMTAIAAVIRLSDPGPILFSQRRTGYRGEYFHMLKFRSMRPDAESGRAVWASRYDLRITKIGRFLRATRMDELPQLWNILKGEMSFVGPRPERPEFYETLRGDIPLFFLRTLVRPGVTGWAQVHSGYAASVAESRLKLEYDLYYIQHMSPRLDLVATLKTFAVAVRGDRVPVEKSPAYTEEPQRRAV